MLSHEAARVDRDSRLWPMTLESLNPWQRKTSRAGRRQANNAFDYGGGLGAAPTL